MRKGFTLIELLVVIAIIAILAVVVVLTLNPAQLLAQSRDATRISDMGTLNSALNLFVVDQNGAHSFSLGTVSTTYISVPDPSATSTSGDNCVGINMPSLAAGDTWGCPASSTPRSITNTGWIPVNLGSISSGSPLGTLPQDPINQTSSNLYYTYTAQGNQYEVTAALESQKYKASFGTSPEDPKYPEVLAQGSNLALSALWNPTGLVGWWPLVEGSSTMAEDGSGNGDNGTWSGTQTGTSGYYSAGKVGTYAGTFDGSTNYINIPNSAVEDQQNITISLWFKSPVSDPNGATWEAYVDKYSGHAAGYVLELTGGHPYAGLADSSGSGFFSLNPTATTYHDGVWHMMTFTLGGSNADLYVDSSLVASSTGVTWVPTAWASGIAIGSLGGSSYADVTLNDIRIYSRALSAAEVLALYNAEH